MTTSTAVTTPGSADATNMQALINVAQAVSDMALPDFVPLSPVCSATDIGDAVGLAHGSVNRGSERSSSVLNSPPAIAVRPRL